MLCFSFLGEGDTKGVAKGCFDGESRSEAQMEAAPGVFGFNIWGIKVSMGVNTDFRRAAYNQTASFFLAYLQKQAQCEQVST